MGGFSAISAGNGWLIAALGVSVVFFGLASLAFIISYFPRAIRWWNNHAQTPKRAVQLLKGFSGRRTTEATVIEDSEKKAEPKALDDAEEALRLLTAHMSEPFKLPKLIEVAEQRGLVRVHSTINRLLLRGAMVGGADGLFRWTTPKEKRRQVKNRPKESK